MFLFLPTNSNVIGFQYIYIYILSYFIISCIISKIVVDILKFYLVQENIFFVQIYIYI